MYRVNNSVNFGGQLMIGPEEFIEEMFEALDIIVDRCPKRRPLFNSVSFTIQINMIVRR